MSLNARSIRFSRNLSLPNVAITYLQSASANSMAARRGTKRRSETKERWAATINVKCGWDTGVSVLQAFKPDHLQPVKRILSQKISHFFTFILGSPIIFYPREGKLRKRDSPTSGWDTGASVLWVFKVDHLQPVKLILSQQFSNFLTFILGTPIIYYPGERKIRKR